jgi:hypothetical protein
MRIDRALRLATGRRSGTVRGVLALPPSLRLTTAALAGPATPGRPKRRILHEALISFAVRAPVMEEQ